MPERLSVSEFKKKYDSFTKEDRKLYNKIWDEKDNLKYFEDTFKEDADVKGQPWWKDLKQKKEDLEKESMERTDEWNNTDKNDKEKSDEVYARYAETMKKLDEVTRQIDSEAKEHKDQTIKLLEERLADKYDIALAGANYNLEQIDEETKQINEEANAQIEKINSRIKVVQSRLQENLKFMQDLDRDSDAYKKRSRIVEKYNNELKDKLWPEFKNINQEKDKKISYLETEKDEYTRVKGTICEVLDYLGKKKTADKGQKVDDNAAKKAEGQKLAKALGGAAAAKAQTANKKPATKTSGAKTTTVVKPKAVPVKKPVKRVEEKAEPSSKAKFEMNAQYDKVYFQGKDSQTRFSYEDGLSSLFDRKNARQIRKVCFDYLKKNYGKNQLILRLDLRELNPALLYVLMDGIKSATERLEDADVKGEKIIAAQKKFLEEQEELLYNYVFDKDKFPCEYLANLDNPDISKIDDKTFIRLNRQVIRDNRYFGTNFKAIPFLGLKTFLSKVPGLRTLQSSKDAVKMLPSGIAQREDEKLQDNLAEAQERIRKEAAEKDAKAAAEKDKFLKDMRIDRTPEEDDLFEDIFEAANKNGEFYYKEIPEEEFLKDKDPNAEGTPESYYKQIEDLINKKSGDKKSTPKSMDDDEGR